jgi:hypothetical protein
MKERRPLISADLRELIAFLERHGIAWDERYLWR